MTTKTTTRYWANDNGSICCDDHAGAYLTAAMEARPRAKAHRTPLGTWEQLTTLEVTFMRADFGVELCETCRYA